VGPRGERGYLVANPLGDPLEVDWARIQAPGAEALAANRRAMADAMLQVIGSRGSWARRRDELRAHARSELSPEPFSRKYAQLLRRFAGA
jgi:hypothetical protein